MTSANYAVTANVTTFIKSMIWGSCASIVAAFAIYAILGMGLGFILALVVMPFTYFFVATLAIVDTELKLQQVECETHNEAASKGLRRYRHHNRITDDDHFSKFSHDDSSYDSYLHDPCNSHLGGNIYNDSYKS